MLESYRSYLKTPPVELADLYIRLKCSPFGEEYSRYSFLRTPITEIRFILQKWAEEEKRRANIASISTAKLSHIVLQTAAAMSGSKEKIQVKLENLLPFELESDNDTENDLTRQILSKLVRSRRIPTHVIAALSPYISPG